MATPMYTQPNFVTDLNDATGISKSDIRHILDSGKEILEGVIAEGNRVKLFGLVQVESKLKKSTKARVGRNPSNGEEVKIAAKPASVVLKARLLKPAKEIELVTTQKLKRLLSK